MDAIVDNHTIGGSYTQPREADLADATEGKQALEYGLRNGDLNIYPKLKPYMNRRTRINPL